MSAAMRPAGVGRGAAPRRPARVGGPRRRPGRVSPGRARPVRRWTTVSGSRVARRRRRGHVRVLRRDLAVMPSPRRIGVEVVMAALVMIAVCRGRRGGGRDTGAQAGLLSPTRAGSIRGRREVGGSWRGRSSVPICAARGCGRRAAGCGCGHGGVSGPGPIACEGGAEPGISPVSGRCRLRGQAIGEYQTVFEGHRGAFGHVG